MVWCGAVRLCACVVALLVAGQGDEVRCSVLHHDQVCCSILQCFGGYEATHDSFYKGVVVRSSVLQYLLQYIAGCCRVLQCVAVSCSVFVCVVSGLCFLLENLKLPDMK